MLIPRLENVRTLEKLAIVTTMAADARIRDSHVPEPREELRDSVRATMIICTKPPYVYGLVILFLEVLNGRGDIPLGNRNGVDHILPTVQLAGSGEFELVGIPGGASGSEITGVLGGATSTKVEEIWWLYRVTPTIGLS